MKRKDVGAGYSSFACIVEEFQKLGTLPGDLEQFSLPAATSFQSRSKSFELK